MDAENQVIKKETKDQFIQRKMSEMKSEFPDQKQRLAVAYSLWEKAHKGGSMEKAYKAVMHNLAKAKEGDTRSIFGKPATFTGGKWVTDGGGQSKPAESKPKSDVKLTPMKSVPEKKLRAFIESNGKNEDYFGHLSSLDEDQILNLPDDLQDDATDLRHMVLDSLGVENDTMELKDLDKAFFENTRDMNPEEYEKTIANVTAKYNEIVNSKKPVEEACDKNPVKKSIGQSYKTVMKNLAGTQDSLFSYGTTTVDNEHSHSYRVDVDGNGQTNGLVGNHAVEHVHKISDFKVQSSQNHTHELI